MDSAVLLDRAKGDCIHASNTEFIGAAEGHQEAYHYSPTTSTAERWYISLLIKGTCKLKNRAYGTYLHCSATVYTGSNLNVYSFRYDTDDGNNFYIEPVECTDQREVSGYFRLRSARTSRYVYFSEVGLTPRGRKEVHQIVDPSNSRPIK